MLYAIDTALNVTVPGFDSCTFRFKINEIDMKKYNVNMKGTWFSGHSLSAKGFYIDRNSAIKTYHQIKFRVLSPSFEDVLIDLIYARDGHEFKFDTQVEYNAKPYGLKLNYLQKSNDEQSSYAEVIWVEKHYWVLGNLISNESKKLTVEVHIDKIRDIHLTLRGFSNMFKKEVGIEMKWDANRDPTQKLAISGEFNTPRRKTYDGAFSMTYPDRTFSGTFDLSLAGSEYKGNSILSWSPNDAITLTFTSGSDVGPAKNLWITLRMDTPFEGWKQNHLDGKFYFWKNLLITNGSLQWAESQNLAFDLMGDYLIDERVFSVEVKAAINSSIPDIPTISTYVKHRYDEKRIDTDLTFKKIHHSQTPQIFSVKSGWQFDFNEQYKNISGSLLLRSPFDGYNTGALVSKFSLNNAKQLKGAADLQIEDRKYTLALEGQIRKITDNMLVLNITTPIERFRHIEGRFGLSEKDKHVVAEVRAPAGALGIEVLFSVISSSDFDIKFNLETPLEAFEKVKIIAKVNTKTIDLRGGWNKVMIGFVGTSRMNQINDFEYSYKIYTPLENFEENGFVARCVILRNIDFDIEMSVKLAKYKVGLIFFGKPKPKLIQQLGVSRTKFDLVRKFLPENDDMMYDEDDYFDEEDLYDDDLINLTGYTIIDLLNWPTIRGEFDVEEISDFYLCTANLKLPQGIVYLRDQLYYPHYMLGNNTLSITTPFEYMKEITSRVQWDIQLDKPIIVSGTDVNVFNAITKEWSGAGYFVNYTKMVDESELKSYDVTVNLKTPLTDLPKLNIKVNLEFEENSYRGNITGVTKTTELSVAGGLESDVNFLDVFVRLALATPLYPRYTGKIFLRKDFSEVENSIDVGFVHVDRQDESNVSIFQLSSQTKFDEFLITFSFTPFLPLSISVVTN